MRILVLKVYKDCTMNIILNVYLDDMYLFKMLATK